MRWNVRLHSLTFRGELFRPTKRREKRCFSRRVWLCLQALVSVLPLVSRVGYLQQLAQTDGLELGLERLGVGDHGVAAQDVVGALLVDEALDGGADLADLFQLVGGEVQVRAVYAVQGGRELLIHTGDAVLAHAAAVLPVDLVAVLILADEAAVIVGNTGDELQLSRSLQSANDSGFLYSGHKDSTVSNTPSYDATIHIKQKYPLPLTITSVSAVVNFGDY